MNKLLNKLGQKAKDRIGHSEPTGSASASADDWKDSAWNAPPTVHQMYTYRKQRGVNLGSLFTLETWLTASLFRDVSNAKSEFDLCRSLDPQTVKERLEHHWTTFIDAGDWKWMADNGVNTVRLPISYYHFLAGHPDERVRALIDGTDYAPFVDIYRSAFNCIVQTIQRAAEHGIGCLIDLHAAPGGQNDQGHCGLSSGKADFFGKWPKRTIAILLAIAETCTHFDNVVGLELLNEPQNHHSLPAWYAEAIHAICSRYGPRIPLYLGDCWSGEQYAKLIKQNNNKGFLVMDHHLYRCFTATDHGKSAGQHAQEVRPDSQGPSKQFLDKTSQTLDGSLVIGEWSAALHHTSLEGDKHAKNQQQREWAHAQLSAYDEFCAGFYFWTLKKEGPSDAGWCLYSAIEQGVLPSGLLAPPLIKHRNVSVDDLKRKGAEIGQARYEAHVNYWNAHANGKPMRHDLYQIGFTQMWSDCITFYAEQASTIGFAGRWIDQRRRAYAQQVSHLSDGSDWEFQHGAQQAWREFRQVLHG